MADRQAADRLADRLEGRQADRLADRLEGRQADRQAGRLVDRLAADRLADRQAADRLEGRQALMAASCALVCGRVQDMPFQEATGFSFVS